MGVTILEKNCDRLKDSLIVEACGHRIQQEPKDQGDEKRLNFLRGFAEVQLKQLEPVWEERRTSRLISWTMSKRE